MTDTITATVTVPAATLKTAANVSQTTLKITSGIALFGAIIGIVGPALATFFPTEAHAAAAVASAVSGFGITALALVHQLNLGASAEAVTNAYIDSVTGAAKEVASALGGSQASGAAPAANAPISQS